MDVKHSYYTYRLNRSITQALHPFDSGEVTPKYPVALEGVAFDTTSSSSRVFYIIRGGWVAEQGAFIYSVWILNKKNI